MLKKLYPTENTQSIADKLGRPLQSVKSIAYLNGLKKVGTAPVWSRQEETQLRKMYPDNSIRDIANQLGRTVLAVTGRAHKLGISKPQHIWSKKELNLLRKLYPSRTIQQIADQIGRPVPATRMRIHRLGLKKKSERERRKSATGLFGCLELVVKRRLRGEDEAVYKMHKVENR